MVNMSSMPIIPARRVANTKPVMAPYVPSPKNTRVMIRAVLMVDWLTSMMLLRCIFSMPVKAAVAVFISALVNMVDEAIWISSVVAGRLKMVVAMKSDSKKPMTESVIPRAISKSSPDM